LFCCNEPQIVGGLVSVFEMGCGSSKRNQQTSDTESDPTTGDDDIYNYLVFADGDGNRFMWDDDNQQVGEPIQPNLLCMYCIQKLYLSSWKCVD